MAGDKMSSPNPSWMSRHRATLVKLGLGVGVGLLGAGIVRQHDRSKSAPSDFAEAFSQRSMTWPGLALVVDQVGLQPGLPVQVVSLSEVLAPGPARKAIVSLSTDEEPFVAQLRDADRRPAVGWYQEDSGWVFDDSEHTFPTSNAGEGESGRRRTLAAVWVGTQATQAAIGVAHTLADGSRSFQPLDTGFENAFHPWEVVNNMVGDIPVFRPIAPPVSGNSE